VRGFSNLARRGVEFDPHRPYQTDDCGTSLSSSTWQLQPKT
jgi:hypothetical protein